MASPPPKQTALQTALVHKRAITYCILISIASLTIGFDATSLLPMPQFQRQFGREYNGAYVVPATHQAIWNAMLIPGCLLGAAISGPIGNLWGRRSVFVIGSVVLAAGLLQLQLCTEWRGLAVGKLLQYVGGTMYGVGVPTYISEVAPPPIRGIMLSLVNLTIYIWLFVCSCAIQGFLAVPGNWAFRAVIVLNHSIPLLVFGGIWFMPETPYWLLASGRAPAAREAVLRLYGKGEAEERLKEVEDAVAARAGGKAGTNYVECFRGVNLRRTLIACGILAGQQLVGMIFIFGYTNYFFTLAGINAAPAFTLTAVLMALQIVAGLASCPLIERLGRRPLLLSGISVMLVAHIIIGCIGTRRGFDQGAMPMVVVACVFVFSLAFQFSVGSAGWAVAAEVSSLETRASTQSIAVAVNYVSCAAVFLSVPYLINPDAADLGPRVCFVFGFFAALTLVFVYFCVPEMRGRTYEELEYMFQQKVPARGFVGFVVPDEVEGGDGEKALGVGVGA